MFFPQHVFASYPAIILSHMFYPSATPTKTHKPNRVFPIGQNMSDTISSCVKGQLLTITGPDSPGTVCSLYKEMILRDWGIGTRAPLHTHSSVIRSTQEFTWRDPPTPVFSCFSVFYTIARFKKRNKVNGILMQMAQGLEKYMPCMCAGFSLVPMLHTWQPLGLLSSTAATPNII